MDDDGHGDDNNKEVVHGKNDEKEVILTITLITVEYKFKLVYFPPFVIIIPCDR